MADEPKTGDSANIDTYIAKDGGDLAATTNSVSEVDSTDAPGVYKLVLSVSETDCEALVITAASSTSYIRVDSLPIHSNRIAGPYGVEIGDVYNAGVVKGDVYSAGSVIGDSYSSGKVKGQIVG